MVPVFKHSVVQIVSLPLMSHWRVGMEFDNIKLKSECSWVGKKDSC